MTVHEESESVLNDLKGRNARDIIEYTTSALKSVQQIETRSALMDELTRAEQANTEANLKKPVLAIVVAAPVVPLKPSFPSAEHCFAIYRFIRSDIRRVRRLVGGGREAEIFRLYQKARSGVAQRWDF